MICAVCLRRPSDVGPCAPVPTCRPCRVSVIRLSWYTEAELNRVQSDAEVTLRRVAAARDHATVVCQHGGKRTPVCSE